MLNILLAAAGTAQPLPAVPRLFGEWIIGCDNRHDCEAIGLPPEDQNPDVIPVLGIVVDRKAENSAMPSVYVDSAGADVEDLTGRLFADGKPTGFKTDKDGRLAGDSVSFARLLAASKSIKLVGPKGAVIGLLPTSGANAAFRWMDDKQDRVGTVTAIVALGARPASSMSPPPGLPEIKVPPNSTAPPHKLTPIEIASVRKRFDLCDEPSREVEYYRVDAGNSIAIVNCWNGPYQSDGIIVVIPDRGPWRFAAIDPPTAEEAKQSDWERSRLISPEYDPKRRLLFMAYRGRGLNDCGSDGSWAWNGIAFKLASYHALDVCRLVVGRLPLWQTLNDPLPED